jgi:hypothetical protein
MVKITHRGDVESQLKEAARILGLKDAFYVAWENTMKSLAKAKMSDAQFNDYVLRLMLSQDDYRKISDGASHDEVLSKSKQHHLAGIHEYYHSGFGQSEIIGTKYGALNAITGFFQNMKAYPNIQSKQKSLLLGRDNKTIQNAYAMLTN